MTGLETSIVPIVVGAIIGFVPNYVMDLRRERSLLRSRWDSPLFELCSEFASAARAFQELCLRRAADPASEALNGDINAEHQRLRMLSERLRLLGDLELQLAVRWIVRHAYAVREVAEGRPDPRKDEFPDESPLRRFGGSMQAFYIAARNQLQVSNPSSIAPREFEAGRDQPGP